jgi:N-acetylneuraminate synthase
MAIPTIDIAGREISGSAPTFFIADIAANHDGDLDRAKKLIHMAKEAGADAAKFQHFQAATIVSDYGFKKLGLQAGHQAGWKKSVFEVYRDASLDPSWTPILKKTCDDEGIVFFTSPYSLRLVDEVDAYVPAYKIGSGDITWIEMVEYIARKGKPVLLAAGASTFDETKRAVDAARMHNRQIVLMQCNTNYTASADNFRNINLNVLTAFGKAFPDVVLGLSDHTPGAATVLGAVALGARVIEKHLTDDNGREGPDHKFSMNPKTWREMVDRTRELEAALGDGVKRVEANERETVVLQRRCLRLRADLPAGHTIEPEDLTPLRPAPEGAFKPYEIEAILGRALLRGKVAGDALFPADLADALEKAC